MSDNKAYKEGYRSYENGWTTDSCHYPENSKKFKDWIEGFEDAQERYQAEEED